MSEPRKDEQRFIVRKYVMATSAQEALEKESSVPVQDVFLDEKQPNKVTDAIGFKFTNKPFIRLQVAK